MQQRLGWAAAQVPCKHILTAGAVGRYNQTNSETGEKVVQEVAIPALLAEMQIARIKRVWEANKVGDGSRANSHEYLLTGRLRFGACGSVPVGTFKNNRRSYVHVWSEIKGPDCGRLVWKDRAEVGTMDRIGDALRNEKSLARDIEAQLGSQHSRIAEVEQRIADRTKTIDELEAKILKKSDLDGIKNAARSVILRDINKLSGQLATAVEEREEAQGERAAIDTSKADAQRIAEHIRYLIGGHVVAS